MRKTVFTLLTIPLAEVAVVVPPSAAQETAEQALGARYEDPEWRPIVPEPGADSPEVWFAGGPGEPGQAAAHSRAEADPRARALARRLRNPHGHTRRLDVRVRGRASRLRPGRLQRLPKQGYGCIRWALHRAGRRCDSCGTARLFLLVAPCPPRASPLSVRHHIPAPRSTFPRRRATGHGRRTMRRCSSRSIPRGTSTGSAVRRARPTWAGRRRLAERDAEKTQPP